MEATAALMAAVPADAAVVATMVIAAGVEVGEQVALSTVAGSDDGGGCTRGDISGRGRGDASGGYGAEAAYLSV